MFEDKIVEELTLPVFAETPKYFCALEWVFDICQQGGELHDRVSSPQIREITSLTDQFAGI